MASGQRSYPKSKGMACYADGGVVNRLKSRAEMLDEAEQEAVTGEKPAPKSEEPPKKGFIEGMKDAVSSLFGASTGGAKQAPRDMGKKKGYADGGMIGMNTDVPNMGGGLPAIGRAAAPMQAQMDSQRGMAGPPTGASMGGYDPMNATRISGFGQTAQAAPAAPMGAQMETLQRAPVAQQLGSAMQDATGGMGGGGRAMRRPGGSGMGGGIGARFDQAQRGGGQMKMGYADGGVVKKKGKQPKLTAKLDKPTDKGNVIRAFADGGKVGKKVPKGFVPFEKGGKPGEKKKGNPFADKGKGKGFVPFGKKGS